MVQKQAAKASALKLLGENSPLLEFWQIFFGDERLVVPLDEFIVALAPKLASYPMVRSVMLRLTNGRGTGTVSLQEAFGIFEWFGPTDDLVERMISNCVNIDTGFYHDWYFATPDVPSKQREEMLVRRWRCLPSGEKHILALISPYSPKMRRSHECDDYNRAVVFRGTIVGTLSKDQKRMIVQNFSIFRDKAAATYSVVRREQRRIC